MVRPLRSARSLIGVALAGLACSSPLGAGNGMAAGSGGSAAARAGGAGTGGAGAADGGADARPIGRFDPDPGPLPDRDTIPGPAPLRRLSLLEYRNTIRDLVAIEAPAPALRGRFSADVGAGDSWFTQGAPIVRGEDAVAFLLSGEAIGDLVTAMVNAPELLYHREQGPSPPIKDGRLVRFGSYEIASRLSYLFWASMPDQQLFDAARDEQLTSDRIVQQARRLFEDPRTREGVEDFHWQWLEGDGLDQMVKDPALGDFSPALVRSMGDESRAFAASLFFGPQADGKLETLLAGTASFADAGLAKIYGLPAPMGTGLQPVTLDANQRAGIFTRAAFLARKAEASDSNPVMRGDAILRRMLCIELGIPPDVVIPPVSEPRPGVTTRERFESVDQQLCGRACHGLIDPLGFALENYNAIGAYRTMDQGKAIDAS